MSIIRAPRKTGNFYILDKAISEDQRLTWAARGLLIYLLGKPDHWRVSPAALRNETALTRKPTGRDGVYSLLDELIYAGYVTRTQERLSSGVLSETHYMFLSCLCGRKPGGTGGGGDTGFLSCLCGRKLNYRIDVAALHFLSCLCGRKHCAAMKTVRLHFLSCLCGRKHLSAVISWEN